MDLSDYQGAEVSQRPLTSVETQNTQPLWKPGSSYFGPRMWIMFNFRSSDLNFTLNSLF